MKNTYIKLFLKFVLFIAAFVVVDLFVGKGFSYLENKAFSKNELSYEQRQRYCIEKATPEIAIIGSSTASHHYISRQMEDSLKMSVFNFGRDGCFFYYQNALINLMLDRYSPKIIIWEIGETSLSSYNIQKEYQAINDLYPWYKNLYIKNVIDKIDDWQRIRMLSNGFRNNSNILLYLRLCCGDYNESNNGYRPITKTTFNQYGRHKDLSQYTIIPEKVDCLLQTLARCEDNDVKVIITSSPRYFDNEVKTCDYYLLLKEIAKNNDIPFIDFYDAKPFSEDSTFFYDNYHLNNKGASLYMNEFIPVLQKELIELSTHSCENKSL